MSSYWFDPKLIKMPARSIEMPVDAYFSEAGTYTQDSPEEFRWYSRALLVMETCFGVFIYGLALLAPLAMVGSALLLGLVSAHTSKDVNWAELPVSINIVAAIGAVLAWLLLTIVLAFGTVVILTIISTYAAILGLWSPSSILRKYDTFEDALKEADSRGLVPEQRNIYMSLFW